MRVSTAYSPGAGPVLAVLGAVALVGLGNAGGVSVDMKREVGAGERSEVDTLRGICESRWASSGIGGSSIVFDEEVGSAMKPRPRAVPW